MTKREVPEWIGKTPDSAIPARVKLRIVERQGGKCCITGLLFGPANKPEFDHIQALANGGENRESNLQAVSSYAHKHKTKKDVAVKAKTERVRKKHLGLHKSKSVIPGSKASRFKKKIGGGVERR